MTRERLKEYLLHPAFLTVPIWIAIIILIPPVFQKYSVKDTGRTLMSDLVAFLYSDLDFDGNSEKISVDLNDKERTKIIVYKNNLVVDQYNIRYQPNGLRSILFDDFNNDNFREIYIFTLSDDSIFLNIIEPLKERKLIVSDRFIEEWRKLSYSTNLPNIKPIGTVSADGTDSDLIFIILTGFNLQPRRAYRYIIEKDSLLKSPDAGFIIQNCTVSDINEDNFPELLTDIQAPGNLDAGIRYTDKFSWFLILDHQMKFVFEPVSLLPYPSDVYSIPLSDNKKTSIAAFARYFGSEEHKSYFCLFDIEGKRLLEKPVNDFDPSNSRIFKGEYSGYKTFFFLRNLDGDVDEYNAQLNIVKKLTILPLAYPDPIIAIDADRDGKKELIFKGSKDLSLVFVRDDFRDPVSFRFAEDKVTMDDLCVSEYLENGSKPALYFQFRGKGVMLRYQKNLPYYLKYPMYALIYGSVLAFILLLLHIQSYRIRQKQETEKRIASLQMKAIKNQIDPHFTLNILNSIGSLYSSPKSRKKADYLFGKYARLIRQTVISSDQIIVPLADEIDFLRNYLDLERFRNDENFSYSVEIADDIDLCTRIPRMLIHTFVENAVKYGVRQREKDGFIRIEMHKKGGDYEIIIEDNGPGITKDSPQGTGRGLHILDELIELFFRLEKIKITYSVENISDIEENVAGTRATVTIPKQKT